MASSPATDDLTDPPEVETRARNERIAGSARRHHFEHAAPVPFLCECSDPTCEALLRITLEEYSSTRAAADFLVAPGHQVDHARIVRVKDAVWLYCSGA